LLLLNSLFHFRRQVNVLLFLTVFTNITKRSRAYEERIW
jgi:hypothetical protein